ncbi:MAG: T9SS type A sorting domain-containing protein [Bacteroidia bacterium]
MTIDNVVDDGITYDFDVVAECSDTLLLNTFQIYVAYNTFAFGKAIVQTGRFSSNLNNNPNVDLYDSLPPPLPFPKYKLINIIDNSATVYAITADTRFLVPTPACYPTDTGRVTYWMPGEKKPIARISMAYFDSTQLPGISLVLSLMLDQFIGGNGQCQLVQGDISVLPLRFVEFRATALPDERVVLNWAAIEEDQSNYYVERRRLGGMFEPIAEIKAQNTQAVQQYQYIDDPGKVGLVEYRIRSLDIDGGIHFSETQTILLGENFNELFLYPNPASSLLKIGGTAGFENLNAKIFDSQGKMHWQGQLSNEGIDISSLAKGMYVLRLGQKNLRFVVCD